MQSPDLDVRIVPPPAAGTPSTPGVPLCVDLDGTLLKSDLLAESLIAVAKRAPWALLAVPSWLARGRATLKRNLAARARIDVTALPYDENVLEAIRRERAAGRRIVLATASDALLAQSVADHLGVFDEVIASDGERNLKAAAKARELTARYGAGGFDYVGADRHDLPAWECAREAYVVGTAPSLEALLRKWGKPVRRIERRVDAAAAILRGVRAYQWSKNLLLLVPLLTAHLYLSRTSLMSAALAFAAFSFAASSVYLANDLLDLQEDRRHAIKRRRPLASGELPIVVALGLLPLLLLAAGGIAAFLPTAFGACLAIYLLANLAYSLAFKRVPILDVFVLAGLYALRILAGAAAIAVPVSNWLLAFSLFAFLSLALAKRYVEVCNVMARKGERVEGRGYRVQDAGLLATLGTASGYLSVLVLALYITSPQVVVLYRSPEMLWLACPLLLYWISRLWFQAHRGVLDEDPLLFALRDAASYAIAFAIFGIMVAAA
jgi:4-hydroxybenzoate polyprenyltransferase/phosphoserine phosphatase